MKQKALFQKGMKAAIWSLMLTAGVLTLGEAELVSAEDGKVTLKVNAPSDGSLVLASMDDLSEEMQAQLMEYGFESLGSAVQTLGDGEMPDIVVYKVSSFVQPGADTFGAGGYYLPEDYADAFAELEDKNLFVEACTEDGKIGSCPMVMIMPVDLLSEDITIDLPAASPQESGSLEGSLSFDQGQTQDGTDYLKIINKDGALTEMLEWKHIPVEGETSRTGDEWSSWNPVAMSTLSTIVTNGTIQMKYSETSDRYPVSTIYEFEVQNGSVAGEDTAEDTYKVEIKTAEDSHLQLAETSGKATQKVAEGSEITAFTFETTKYLEPEQIPISPSLAIIFQRIC